MLLRRVIDHLKDQNWTAVILDFVIVVSGVFIGIQVSNWNDARGFENRKAVAIDRLHDESEQAVRYIRSIVNLLEKTNEERREALKKIATGDWADSGARQLGEALWSNIAPTPAPQRAAFDELIASGLYAELGDPRMREAIANYYSTLNFLQGEMDTLNGQIIALPPAESYDGVHTVYDPESESGFRREFDFAVLSENPTFFNYVARGQHISNRVERWWRGALQDGENMCEEIARVSHRPCQPPLNRGDDE